MEFSRRSLHARPLQGTQPRFPASPPAPSGAAESGWETPGFGVRSASSTAHRLSLWENSSGARLPVSKTGAVIPPLLNHTRQNQKPQIILRHPAPASVSSTTFPTDGKTGTVPGPEQGGDWMRPAKRPGTNVRAAPTLGLGQVQSRSESHRLPKTRQAPGCAWSPNTPGAARPALGPRFWDWGPAGGGCL